MSIGGFFLGLINIGIVVVLLLLLGLAIKLIMDAFITPVTDQMQKLYLALVGLIGLYMLVALIFGLPSLTIMRL